MKNEIKELFENSENLTNKWSNYFNIYEDLFKKYKNKDITFVEIGIHNGGSLDIWRKYFTKYHELCRSSKITKIQACLNYVFQFKDIQGIVLGVDNIFQLNEIMKTQIIKDKLLVSKISSLGIRKKEIIDPRSWKL